MANTQQHLEKYEWITRVSKKKDSQRHILQYATAEKEDRNLIYRLYNEPLTHLISLHKLR